MSIALEDSIAFWMIVLFLILTQRKVDIKETCILLCLIIEFQSLKIISWLDLLSTASEDFCYRKPLTMNIKETRINIKALIV